MAASLSASAHGSGRLAQGGVVKATAAPDQQAEPPGALGGKLQAARGDQFEPAVEPADDAAAIRMAQRLLHRQQARLPSINEDDAAWIHSCALQAVAEHATAPADPDDGTGMTGEDTGGEQRGCRVILDVRTRCLQVVHHSQQQAASGRMLVDCWIPKDRAVARS